MSEHPPGGEMDVIREAEERGRADLWPFWRRAYAGGDPLPRIDCTVSRPAYRFDEGDPLRARRGW
jgi:hypothetical protein